MSEVSWDEFKDRVVKNPAGVLIIGGIVIPIVITSSSHAKTQEKTNFDIQVRTTGAPWLRNGRSDT